MMKITIFFMVSLFNASIVSAKDNDRAVVNGKEANVGNKKVIYTYKQYEKFDFDDLNIEGGSGAPGDLSITQGQPKGYGNKLPYRKSFTVEIKKGIERVR